MAGTSFSLELLFRFARCEMGRLQGDTAINWEQIKGDWNQFQGRVKQQWGKLTDDDLTLIEGRREELIGRLQERYGYAKERAEEEVRNWEKQDI